MPGDNETLIAAQAEQALADGDLDRAADLLRQAARGDGMTAGIARVNLGLLLAQRLGDVSGGLAELWTAAADDRPLVAAAALFNAGVVLEDNGRLDKAQSAYQKSARLRQPGFSGQAANNLGIMLSRQGNAVEAHGAWTLAVEIGDAEVAAKAQKGLDLLAEFRGGTDARARAAAAMNQAEQYLAQGELIKAHGAYETMMATGDPFFAPKAAALVAVLFTMNGQDDGAAVDAIAHLGEIGFPEFEARAWYFYGEFSLRRDGPTRAEACWWRIPESARDAYPAAACALAVLHGDAEAASAAFAEMMEEARELAESVVTTALDVGNLHLDAGDAARAGQAFEIALDLAGRIGSAELAEAARAALAACR